MSILKSIEMDEIAEEQQQLWITSEESIKIISPFHPPMDRKCVAFVNESGIIISNRISNCLREQSIVVEYENTKACCVTKEYVRFTIELYRNNSGILVECVRIRGDTRIFHKICRIVLNASKGGDVAAVVVSSLPDKKLRSSLLPSVSSSSSRPSLLSSSTSSITSSISSLSSSTELGLEIALSLLKKDRLDANLLGMESLVYLTDVHVSNDMQTVLLASYAVLGIDNAGAIEDFVRFMDIHSFIISLVRDGKFSANLVPSDSFITIDDVQSSVDNEDNLKEDDDDDDPLNDNEEHIAKMRSLAYQILLNSLQFIASHNNNSLYQSAYTNLIRNNQLLSSLLTEINKTTTINGLNAHDVTIAIQILHLLLMKQNNEDSSTCVIVNTEKEKKYLYDCVVKVYKVGCVRHKLLSYYCEQLLLFLES